MTQDSQSCGCGGGCGPMPRRDFLKAAGGSAAGMMLGPGGARVMAGPFPESDYLRLIPADKKLDPDWVRSLSARGVPTVYRGREELGYIGMPIGGLCAGTMYLSGDGRLWLWEIFNRDIEGILPERQQDVIGPNGAKVSTRNGANYLNPQGPFSPLDQGFWIDIKSGERPRSLSLDQAGFEEVSFRGEYPMATVTYRDPQAPVTVTLEAFSPFVPLATDDSSLPASVMSYTVHNHSQAPLDVQISGRLENAICLYHRKGVAGTRQNRIVREPGLTALVCTARSSSEKEEAVRPDIVFDRFEAPTYEGWTATGTAFGPGPIKMSDMPGYQGDVGGQGERVVNTHNTRQKENVRGGDAHVGTLTSRPFTIERRYISFLVGGGAHRGKTCVNLLIGEDVIASATGRNNNRMHRAGFDVRAHQGKTARLQVVDQESGGWGNIGLDDIVFTDEPPTDDAMEDLHDFGSMTLAMLGSTPADLASAALGSDGDLSSAKPDAAVALDASLAGAVGRQLQLEPGQQATVTFLVSWHFPNLRLRALKAKTHGRYYAQRFDSALAVARYLAGQFDRLAGQTRLWRDTWYDSTLPYWFLDRTMANTSTLATTTCHRLADGRFYAWEGIGCCAGTCTHVWHYAQAVARLFPELERDTRERVDFGLAFHADTGLIGYRGELHDHHADDGQAGTILRAYREHQMCADSSFLQENWPKIKLALQFLINRDANADGVIEGAQPNTLDASWYGRISWLVSIYLAALRAGEEMAKEQEDRAFAEQCRAILTRGAQKILELYNGEFFIQEPDPQHADAIGVDGGCHIDQVLGQAWAFQVGLGRLFSQSHTRTALQSLWKYNFALDVGPFRKQFEKGRWYAAAGDAGLIMCTWPKGGKREDWQKHWQYQYFNECMSGFEWQVAAHMIWEGMIEEGLAVARAIHDRYHAAHRNPYNEIECSDHYARAMASYGAFLAACGFEYHGPQGHLGFAPRISPHDFRAAFTAAQGWGTFRQRREAGRQTCAVALKYGKLRLASLAFAVETGKASNATVQLGEQLLQTRLQLDGDRALIQLAEPVVVETGQTLQVVLS